MADLPPHRPGLTAGPPDARRPQGRYCVVIPALNAAATIGALVAKVRGCGLNVVVVDDGSTDRTAAVAAAGGALVISHLRNRGKGHALRTGFEYAVRERYDGVVTLDSDGQHDPAEIPALIQAGEVQHAALVLGDRMANGLSMPAARRRTNQVMSRIISRLAGQPVPDSQCGFRLIRREQSFAAFTESRSVRGGSSAYTRLSSAGTRPALAIRVRDSFGSVLGVSLRPQMWVVRLQ